jgi:hypothetical protein
MAADSLATHPSPIAQLQSAQAAQPLQQRRTIYAAAAAQLPGVALCLAITAASIGLEHLESLLFGRAWLESLVLAIALGSAVRTFWSPAPRFAAGITFSAKTLLEVAVVLLGASVSAAAIASEGAALIGAIVAVVVFSLGASYSIDLRQFGDRCGRTGDRRRWRRGRQCDCVHSGVRGGGGAWSAIADAITGFIGDAVWDICRPYCVRGAAGIGRDCSGRIAQCAGRHTGKAGAGTDAGAGDPDPGADSKAEIGVAFSLGFGLRNE